MLASRIYKILTLSIPKAFAFLSVFLDTDAPWAFVTPYLTLPSIVMLFQNTEGSSLLETLL